MRNPTDPVTITILATAAQWQDFITFCDSQGIHRTVRPFIDQILQQASADGSKVVGQPQRPHPVADAAE